MQDPATYTEAFEREHGCTAAEWRRWLPGAVGDAALAFDGDGAANVQLAGGGTLRLQWWALPPRQIALVRMPCLRATYRFDRVSAEERGRFMRRFDLYMQRGGG